MFETLAGSVTDTALRPLAGAVVEILDGTNQGTNLLSDAKGFFLFRFEWAIDGKVRVRATKDRYVAATGTPVPVKECDDACQPVWWISFPLASLAQPVNLSGNYTLTLVADRACTAIPNALQTRTYAATIAPVSKPSSPPGTSFEATITGVPVWGNIQRSLPIFASADFATMILGEDGDVYLAEEVAPSTYYGFEGQAGFSVGAASVSTLSASFDGWAEYWGVDMATPVYCRSANHQMILTRR